MTEPKTQTERAKAYLESQGIRWGRFKGDPDDVSGDELNRTP
jgi:hypothetical protein